VHIYILIAIWCAGIATAAGAIFIPIYENFVIVGAIGWATVAASSGLILYEIKRIRAEDRRKEAA
jgi:NADH:ubiquinone oxidoreductase subunit 6 (subunit J)